MDSNQKYLGMTVPQLGIIGGLAGLLCAVLCVGGWLILGDGVLPSAPQPIPPTAHSTATMFVPPTLTPTIVPTTIPYEQLIPQGWKQHKTPLVEIWLPGEFRKTTKKVIEFYQKQITLELSLTRTPTETTIYNMYVIVAYEPLRGDSLDSHFELAPTLPPETSTHPSRLVEQRDVILNGKPALRLLLEEKTLDNLDFNSLIFVFIDGDLVWYVQYSAHLIEFYTNLETFEKSILTFRPVK